MMKSCAFYFAALLYTAHPFLAFDLKDKSSITVTQDQIFDIFCHYGWVDHNQWQIIQYPITELLLKDVEASTFMDSDRLIERWKFYARKKGSFELVFRRKNNEILTMFVMVE